MEQERLSAPHPLIEEWRLLAAELQKQGWFDRPYQQVTGSHFEPGFGWGSATGGNCPLLLVQVVHDGFETLRLKNFKRRHCATAAEAVGALEDFAQEYGFTG
jgi:hypothetical protein